MRIDMDFFRMGATRRAKPMQDRYLITESSSIKLLTIADGATGANGGLAIEILSQTFNDSLYEHFPESTEEMKKFVENLVQETRIRMVKAAEEAGKISTTFACAIVSANPNESPQVHLARLGDSGFIATHDPEGGGEPVILARGTSYGETTWISSSEEYAKPIPWAQFEISASGRYRVRAYSDGLSLRFDPEKGHGDEHYTEDVIIKEAKSAFEFVNDLKNWSERPDNNWVGMDDMAAVALDIYHAPLKK